MQPTDQHPTTAKSSPPVAHTIRTGIGQFLLAARLYGGVAALRETGAPLAPAEWARYERAIAATQSELAEGAFWAAWEAGRSLPLERVLAEVESLDGA